VPCRPGRRRIATSTRPRGELKASGIKNPTVSLGFAGDQPGRVIVATRDLTGLDFNPTWSIDLAAVRGSA